MLGRGDLGGRGFRLAVVVDLGACRSGMGERQHARPKPTDTGVLL